MIEITNGTRRTTVTKGVFKEVYEPMGWIICEPEKEPNEVPMESKEEGIETPLSEMTLAELKAFAAEKKIDISTAKNKKDIKRTIKAKMEE